MFTSIGRSCFASMGGVFLLYTGSTFYLTFTTRFRSFWGSSLTWPSYLTQYPSSRKGVRYEARYIPNHTQTAVGIPQGVIPSLLYTCTRAAVLVPLATNELYCPSCAPSSCCSCCCSFCRWVHLLKTLLSERDMVGISYPLSAQWTSDDMHAPLWL